MSEQQDHESDLHLEPSRKASIMSSSSNTHTQSVAPAAGSSTLKSALRKPGAKPRVNIASARLHRPEARIPMGYRTLSIHVYDSQRFPTRDVDEHDDNSTVRRGRFTPRIPSIFDCLRGRKRLFGRSTEGSRGAISGADAAMSGVQKGADYFARLDYHKISTEEVCQRFNVSPTAGLDESAAQRRLERNGENAFSKPPSKYYKKLLGYVFGDFCSILWIGVIVFFISWRPLGDPDPQAYNLALAIVILIVIFFQALFAAFQDWSTQRVMNSIMSFLPDNANVVRNGEVQQVPASDLVVGDMVMLSLGQKVPADMRLIECSSDLKFDRSILTGEAEEVAGAVDCNEESNFIESRNVALLGTYVCHGTAKGVVVLTGAKTVMGRINAFTSHAVDVRTNLQKEISRFVKIIISLTVTLVLIMLITWLAWLRVDHYDFLPTVSILTNMMSLVVAFVPEGMPIAVAFTLSLIARRMRDAKVLPKSLSTVETLGCVNVICSDKTGTLTENRMTVVSAALVGELIEVTSLADKIQGGSGAAWQKASNVILRGATLCNDAVFEATDEENDGKEEVNARKAQGNATDVAVLRFAASLPGFAEVQNNHERVFNLPFNSINKFMLTVFRDDKDAVKSDDGAFDVLLKGAPDVLLPRCASFLTASGEPQALSPIDKQQFVRQQEQWSQRGQRVIMLARRSYSTSTSIKDTQFQDEILSASQSELSIIAILGIVDPPRAEIPKTVSDCRRSGARFFMVTGDFGLTAAAIAKQCGILTNDKPDRIAEFAEKGRLVAQVDTVSTSENDPEKAADTEVATVEHPEAPMIEAGLLVEGHEINDLTQAQWNVICRYNEIVFARTTPEQKLNIVNQLRQRGFVVAVTGDGVNDAPALKAADVGIAMVNGSDVAIEAADLILMGSFESIVEGIRLGRLVFQNLQKVISYLLPAGSYSEDWPVLLNVFFGCPLPLSSFLMIIICCFTDLFCCLTLIMEREEFDLLSLPPRNPKKDHLVNARVYGQSYLFIGTMETVTAHAMFFFYIYQAAGIPISKMFFAFARYSDGYYGHSQAQLDHFLRTGQCVYFVTLVILQWGNLLSVRNKRLSVLQADPIRKQRRNLWLFVGPLISLCIAIFVTEEPGLQKLFGTARVPIRHWLIPIPLAVGLLVADELRKLVVRVWPNGIVAKIAW